MWICLLLVQARWPNIPYKSDLKLVTIRINPSVQRMVPPFVSKFLQVFQDVMYNNTAQWRTSFPHRGTRVKHKKLRMINSYQKFPVRKPVQLSWSPSDLHRSFPLVSYIVLRHPISLIQYQNTVLHELAVHHITESIIWPVSERHSLQCMHASLASQASFYARCKQNNALQH